MAKKRGDKPPNKRKGKADAPPAVSAEMTGGEAAASRRVALLRHKLTTAMEDPLMRDQIVKAIRSMMTDGK